MGRLASTLGVVLILGIFVSLSFFIAPNFTGFLIYSKWSNETVALAENTSSNFYGTKTGNFGSTIAYDGNREILKENSTNELLWDYSFGTDFNIKPPTQLIVKFLGVKVTGNTPNEKINISIYNHITSAWESINQTTVTDGVSYENITTTLSWKSRNL